MSNLLRDQDDCSNCPFDTHTCVNSFVGAQSACIPTDNAPITGTVNAMAPITEPLVTYVPRPWNTDGGKEGACAIL